LYLVINSNIICEHFSKDIIDFEQKPIEIESLNERDVIVSNKHKRQSLKHIIF